MQFKFIIILAVLPFITQAQINESDTARVQLRSSITGNYQQGNVQLFALRGRIELSAAGKASYSKRRTMVCINHSLKPRPMQISSAETFSTIVRNSLSILL